jgi:hypothetical protein
VPEHIEDGYTNLINTHLQKIKLLAQVPLPILIVTPAVCAHMR